MIRFAALLLCAAASACASSPNPAIVERYEGFGRDSAAREIFEFTRSRSSPEDLPSVLAILKDLCLRFPENVPVHREYQDRMVLGGQREEALQEYRERLEERRSPPNLYLLARLESSSEQGWKLLREAVAREKEFFWGLYALAVHHREEGDRERAKGYLSEALAVHPEFLPAIWQLAEIQESEDPEAAKETLKRYIELRPGDIRAHFNLGLVYLQTDRPKGARDQFELILRLEPGNPDALYGKAAALTALAEVAAAMGIYRQILAADPKQSLAHYNLGILYEQNLKDPEAALREYEAFYEGTSEGGQEFFLRRVQAEIWIENLKKSLGKG